MNRRGEKALAAARANWLTGGGEMGKLIRKMDWSRTPVGPIESWPQSLKTAVNIILHSRYPLFVWWGRELTNIYNDAYIPMLGARHPQALGQSAPNVWADVWPVVGPQAEVVMREGRATWNESLLLVMERYGYAEETYFSFSYSPAPDGEGGVGGVFCAVTEDTSRVLGARRMKTLRDLGGRSLVEAKTAEQACRAAAVTLADNLHDFPFALIYLLDEDGERARLCETVDLSAGTKASPSMVTIDSGDDVWNFSRVIETGQSQIIEDLEERFGRLPGGPWADDWTKSALALPLAKAVAQELPAGFLVAGTSPRLAFNDDYRSFLDLAAGQIANAISNARAYEEERKRAEALAEIDRAKTAFFSNVSHEFRTPLTLMLGPLEDTLAEDGVSPEAHERLNVAHRNSLRLLKLVNTLLDFSRIEAGRIQAVYEPVDLAALTSDLASVFRSAVERAGMRLIVDCPPLAQPVYVDREMWEKITLNLISNAFKFTFEGEIEVSLKRAGASVELVVRDTGVGIPAEELPRIFDRFHRVKGVSGRSYEGSGIGLALVHELVKLHGGTARVESEVGRGSAFIVSILLGKAHLPAECVKTKDGEEQARTATAPSARAFVEEALRWLPEGDGATGRRGDGAVYARGDEAPIPGERLEIEDMISRRRAVSPSPSPRILLADDNSDMREYVRRLLVTDYEVEAVADGEAALQAARERTPDLVLSDVMMPRLDGFGLLKALREDELLATIPFILLSARAGEEARVEGVEAGADDYLIKPFSARELLARVRSHLEMTRLRREAEMALRHSEKRFRELANNAPIIIWMADEQGNNEFVNNAYLTFFGVTPDEAAERRWSDLVHPDDYETYVQKFLDASAACLPFRAEARVRRADGEWRWLDSYSVPRSTESGHTSGMIGCSVDITERRQAEDAMGQLAAIVESSDDSIVSQDLNGVIRSWNKGAEKLFGYAAEEVIGKSIMIVIPPDRAEEETRVLEGVRRGEKIDHFETKRRRKDGALVEISLTVSPLRDKAGSVIGASKISRDITERKRVEQALDEGARQQRALYQLADHLHRARSLDDVYNAALDAILSALRCDRAAISLFDDSGVMRFAGWRGLSAGYRNAVEGHSPWKPDKRYPEPVCVNDVDLAEIDDSLKAVAKSEGIGALASIPLVSRGKLIGKLVTYFNAPHVFSDGDLALSLTIARQLAFGIERQRAEELLRQNAAQLTLITDTAPVFIAHCDPQARFKFVNKAYAGRFGLAPEDCIGKSIPEVVGEEAYRSFSQYVEAALRGEPVGFEVEIPYDVIGKRFMHCSYAPEFDASGKVVGFVAAITDISARKQAEEKLIATTAKFESVFNQSGIFAAITDLQGYLREVNDQAANWCGYTREQVLDRPFWETPWWRGSEEVKARVRAATEQAAAGMVFREELPYWWADGTERMAVLAIHPIRDQAGRVILLHPTGLDITERKRSEETLKLSEERLSLALKVGAIGTFDWDIPTDKAFLTEKTRAILGLPLSKSTISYEDWRRCVHPDDISDREAKLQDAYEHRLEEWPGQYRILRADTGELRWVESTVRIFYDAQGAPLRMIGTILDITDRIAAEEAIRESEARLRQLADAMPQIVFTCSSDGFVDYANQQWSEYVGVPVEQSTGRKWMEAVHPDDLESMEQRARKAVETGQPFDTEFRLRRKDGQYRWQLSRAIPIRNSQGRILKWIGTATDIHDRKQAEAEREESLASERAARADAEHAAESIRRLQAVTDSALAPLTLDDLLHEMLLRIRELLATDSSAILLLNEDGQSLSMRATIGWEETVPDLLVPVGQGVAGAIAASHAPLVVEDLSAMEVIHPILRQKARSLIGAPLIVEGRLIGVIHADTTRTRRFTEDDVRLLQLAADRVALAIEHMRLYEVEQQARRQAEEANRMKDEFLALVSHELRSPLNAILGYTRMLRSGGGDREDLNKATGVIERSAKAQLRIVEDLLDSARIVTGKMRIEPSLVDLVPALEAALDTVRSAAEAKSITLVANFRRRPELVLGDSTRLQQVVWNLLTNAIKFTPEGGRVELRMEGADDHIRIVVSDTGKGVEPEFLPFVFDRFRQADASSGRRYGGVGLGLSLVKHLVELHGGTITVASEGAGRGATFTITLPRRHLELIPPPPPAVTSREVRMEGAIPRDQTLSLVGVDVLVVDDQEEARVVLTQTLSEYGAQVTVVSSGAEALAILSHPPEGRRPDALILDIAMPDEDGYAVLKKVRALEAEQGAVTPQIPAIALTAYARAEDRFRALQAGFQMHVAKPVDPTELAVVILSIIKRFDIKPSS